MQAGAVTSTALQATDTQVNHAPLPFSGAVKDVRANATLMMSIPKDSLVVHAGSSLPACNSDAPCTADTAHQEDISGVCGCGARHTPPLSDSDALQDKQLHSNKVFEEESMLLDGVEPNISIEGRISPLPTRLSTIGVASLNWQLAHEAMQTVSVSSSAWTSISDVSLSRDLGHTAASTQLNASRVADAHDQSDIRALSQQSVTNSGRSVSCAGQHSEPLKTASISDELLFPSCGTAGCSCYGAYPDPSISCSIAMSPEDQTKHRPSLAEVWQTVFLGTIDSHVPAIVCKSAPSVSPSKTFAPRDLLSGLASVYSVPTEEAAS